MGQEFQAVACFLCGAFQSQAVKKSGNRFACRLCGERQSVRKVQPPPACLYLPFSTAPLTTAVPEAVLLLPMARHAASSCCRCWCVASSELLF